MSNKKLTWGFVNEVRLLLGKELKLEAIKTEAGDVTLVAEKFEEGYSIGIQAGDGTIVPAPVGEHTLADGRIVVVEEEGIIAMVKEATTEEAPAEVEASEAPAETPATDPAPTAPKRVVESVSKEMFFEAITELKEHLTTEIKAQLEAEKEVMLSAIKPLEPNTSRSTTVQKSYEEMTNLEKAKFNRGKL